MPDHTRIDSLELRGGKLCLDFLNTVGWHASSDPVEWLATYEDLMCWSRYVGILTAEQVTSVCAFARRQPGEAQRIYRRAIHLRDTLYRLFLAVLRSEAIDEADLALLNEENSVVVAQQRIVVVNGGVALTWPDAGRELEAPLWFIIQSAVDVLTSEALERVHMCAGLGCGWLFFDQSKNRSRKWCDSQDCGNRERVRRHYHTSRVRTTRQETNGE